MDQTENTLSAESPSISSSVSAIKDLLTKKQPKADPQTIAGFLALAADNTSWNGPNIGSALAQVYPSQDWKRVIDALDNQVGFSIPNGPTLGNILKAISCLPQNNDFSPLEYFLGREWASVTLQASIIHYIISSDNVGFDLFSAPLQRVLPSQIEFKGDENLIRIADHLAKHQPLDIFALCQSLLNIADRDDGSAVITDSITVKSLLELAAKSSPDLLLLCAIQTSPPWSPMRERLIANLFDLFFFGGHPRTQFVFYCFWHINQSLFRSLLSDYYIRNPSDLDRIVTIVSEIGKVDELAKSWSFNANNNINYNMFVFDFACLAAHRDLLDLESYFTAMYDAHGDNFVSSIMTAMSQKAISDYGQVQSQNPLSPILNLKVVYTLLRLLSSHSSSETLQQLRLLQTQAIQTYPRLINLDQGHDDAILAQGDSNMFTPEVEKEMKLYYQQMYEQEITISEIIVLLQRLKDSKDPIEQDVFACMVHSLFDEYRFFPEYPLAALATTAVLFGSLIQFHLIDGMPLAVALRFVMEALNEPPESKMFKFGLQALLQFNDRLTEFPQYCSVLLSIPALSSVQPQLAVKLQNITQDSANFSQPEEDDENGADNDISTINNINNNDNDNNNNNNDNDGSRDAEGVVSVPVTVQDDSWPPFRSISVDVINLPNGLQFEDPPMDIKDRMQWLANNMAKDKIDEKYSEISSLIKEPYYSYFADYLTNQRAKLEVNNQVMYLRLLEVIDSQLLYKLVINCTYLSSLKTLNSKESKEATAERGHLKALGSWLGSLTLARNVPIRYRNLSVKDFLLEGLETQRLLVVVPFVCKVLEGCSHSKVFTKTNPWLLSIFKVLSELYHYFDLKLNLKFEIEVCCTHIGVDIHDIEPANFLRSRPPLQALHPQHQPVSAAPMNTLPPIVPGTLGDSELDQEIEKMSLEDAARARAGAAHGGIVGGDYQQGTFDESAAAAYAFSPGIKRILQLALDRAIKENLAPISEKAISTAGVCTRELVLKDFALEGDELKLRKAAQVTIRALAGQMALVSCKETLRASYLITAKALLTSSGYGEQSVSPELVRAYGEENMDVAAMVLVKATMDKSVAEIDEALGPAYLARKRHRELRPNQPFIDPQVNRQALALPEPFNLKPGGLSPAQLTVYNDFSRFTPFDQSQQTTSQTYLSPYRSPSRSAALPSQLGAISGGGSGGTPFQQSQQQQLMGQFPGQPGVVQDANAIQQQQIPTNKLLSPEQESVEQVVTQFQAGLDAVLKVTKEEAPETHVSMISEDHKLRVMMTQMLSLMSRTSMRDQTIIKCSQLIVSALFTVATSDLARESLALLLAKLCELSSATAKEVVAWLIHSDDERKYDVDVMTTLIRTGLVNPQDLDINLAGHIAAKERSAVDFAVGLIMQAVLSQTPCALRSDFTACLRALEPLALDTPPDPAVKRLFESLEQTSRLPPRLFPEQERQSITLKDQMAYVFAEWLRLLQHPAQNEKLLFIFVYQMGEQGILNNPEHLYLFFHACLEIGLETCSKDVGVDDILLSEAYLPVDALAKLVVILIRATTEGEDTSSAVSYLKELLTVICGVLAQFHESLQTRFNEKPFFRFFSSLLAEWNYHEEDYPALQFPFYKQMALAFRSLQPLCFPAFSFAWLTLISHRLFMAKLLGMPDKKGWPYMLDLFEALLRFQSKYFLPSGIVEPIKLIYKGTLRIVLVVLHDFPEFFVENHYSLCNYIPPASVQLRNLILSAFPQSMTLPDPFTQGLKVDRLPEIRQTPILARDPGLDLEAFGLKELTDKYLENPAQSKPILDALVNLVRENKPHSELGLGFDSVSLNLRALNALIFYVGVQAVADAKKGSMDSTLLFNTKSPQLTLITNLILALDAQGRYFALSTIANQLRYPNSDTHYFSCVLLYLFGTAYLGEQQLDIQQQITRVLLERLICNRPHPWGLLITFTELLKNSHYNFWQLPFADHAPEIEKLFGSLFSHINGSR